MIDQFTDQADTLRQYVQKAMQKSPEEGFLVIHGQGVARFRRGLYDALKLFHERAVYPYDYSWLRRPYNRKQLAQHAVLMSTHTRLPELELDKLMVRQLLGEDARKQGWEGRLTGVVLCLEDSQKPKFRGRKLKAMAKQVQVDARGATLSPDEVLSFLRAQS